MWPTTRNYYVRYAAIASWFTTLWSFNCEFSYSKRSSSKIGSRRSSTFLWRSCQDYIFQILNWRDSYLKYLKGSAIKNNKRRDIFWQLAFPIISKSNRKLYNYLQLMVWLKIGYQSVNKCIRSPWLVWNNGNQWPTSVMMQRTRWNAVISPTFWNESFFFYQHFSFQEVGEMTAFMICLRKNTKHLRHKLLANAL